VVYGLVELAVSPLVSSVPPSVVSLAVLPASALSSPEELLSDPPPQPAKMTNATRRIDAGEQRKKAFIAYTLSASKTMFDLPTSTVRRRLHTRIPGN
jgi:hypothetical protein